jgi:hypothetical protein
MRKLWVGGGAWRSTDIIISPSLQSSEKKGILAELNQVPHFLNIIMYLYTFGFMFTLAHCGWNMQFTSCNNSIGFRVSFHLSISSGTQYRTLQRCFSHPRLVIYFFPIPPTKWKSYNWDMLWVFCWEQMELNPLQREKEVLSFLPSNFLLQGWLHIEHGWWSGSCSL